MRTADTGCYPESEIYFPNPGNPDCPWSFYPICAGHYLCGPSYRVRRTRYDSFLLMYIKSGRGFFSASGKTHPFCAGDLVCADCYLPHAYGTDCDSEILWLHFDGPAVRGYVEAIHKNRGPVCSLKDGLAAEKEFSSLLALLSGREPAMDALCSLSITRLLTMALLSPDGRPPSSASGCISDSIAYIRGHIGEELTLRRLADMAGLSPYYFTRLFKKETGCTPHSYILRTRIHMAKFYLKTSPAPIKEICFCLGFSTESSFCTAFKKICRMTPGEYRAQAGPGKTEPPVRESGRP